MDKFYIDINCDLGEGLGNEEDLMPLISSCNVACGGHAGDKDSMLEVVRLAKKHRVKVGAHPAYPDRENFGRISMNMNGPELIQSLKDQMLGFIAILEKEKVHLHHIKPHGALYNDLSRNDWLSELFLEAVQDHKQSALLYLPFGSSIANKAIKNGFSIKYEAFADRNYNADLSLVSRQLPNALINKPEQVLKHMVSMIKKQTVTAVDGEEVAINSTTYCIHGDTPSVFKILNYLSAELPKHNIAIENE